MNILNLYTMVATANAAAEGAPAEGTAGVSMVWSLIMLGLMLVVFYFMLIRPQKKKEKEAKRLRDNLQIGDEVTTIGGITGIIVRKQEDTIVIETGGDRSKIRVKLWAIAENATVHDAVEETLAK
ncbi:MAG: preprotein translocase subunit YajC [Ruminococcus sp.]|nr:preprotein translocase subunit YajC [Ruminococcus sp.]